MEMVYDAAHALESMPERFELAAESERIGYEIRRLLVGKHLLLYTIVEADTLVRIVGFRHASQLPRSGDLPPEPSA